MILLSEKKTKKKLLPKLSLFQYTEALLEQFSDRDNKFMTDKIRSLQIQSPYKTRIRL
jgi:hypothetical protein